MDLAHMESAFVLVKDLLKCIANNTRIIMLRQKSRLRI
ncbi:hypothetical protein Lser_V15G39322 [Lactuca serriola]